MPHVNARLALDVLVGHVGLLMDVLVVEEAAIKVSKVTAVFFLLVLGHELGEGLVDLFNE